MTLAIACKKGHIPVSEVFVKQFTDYKPVFARVVS